MNQSTDPISQFDPRHMMEQEEEGIDFLYYWRVVRKYLFEIIGLAVAVGILAALYANSLVPIYSASTKVSIERVSPATGGYSDVSWYSMQQYPGTQYQIIKSKSVAELVVENLKLWENQHFQKKTPDTGSPWKKYIPFLNKSSEEKEIIEEDSKTDEEKIADKKKSLVGMVQGGITVEPVKDTFVVQIGFSSSSPASHRTQNFLQGTALVGMAKHP